MQSSQHLDMTLLAKHLIHSVVVHQRSAEAQSVKRRNIQEVLNKGLTGSDM